MEETGITEKVIEILMKIYRMEEKPEDVMSFIFRQLCDENYPSDEEIDQLKLKLKKLQGDKERRTLTESIKNEKRPTPEEIQKMLNEKFTKLQMSEEKSKSLLKKYLTDGVFNNLREVTTSFEGSFLDNIQSGLTVFDQEVGVFASDADAYSAFSDLFDPILEHLFDIKQDDDSESETEIKIKQEVKEETEEIEELKDLDPEKLFVKSIKIACNRSLKNFPFVSIASSHQFAEISETISDILTSIEDEELEGTFEEYQDIEEHQKKMWLEEGILFKEPEEEFLKAAKTNRLWPHARGIFLNTEKTVRVWVNQQDHMLVISSEDSGNFKAVYDRLKKLLTFFDDVEFAKDEKWGFLAHNLKMIGNGMEISTEIKIPQLMKEENSENFNLFVDKKFFNVEDLGRCHLRLSTNQRVGVSETELCRTFQSKICDIIIAEKCLYKKEEKNGEETKDENSENI